MTDTSYSLKIERMGGVETAMEMVLVLVLMEMIILVMHGLMTMASIAPSMRKVSPAGPSMAKGLYPFVSFFHPRMAAQK